MKKIVFEIKSKHLKLLKRAYVDWDDCEFGAPCINPKRPYGNSDVYKDMAEILNIKEVNDEELNNQTRELYNLHKELETVLQICLRTQKFETGKFESDEYGHDWKKVK